MRDTAKTSRTRPSRCSKFSRVIPGERYWFCSVSRQFLWSNGRNGRGIKISFRFVSYSFPLPLYPVAKLRYRTFCSATVELLFAYARPSTRFFPLFFFFSFFFCPTAKGERKLAENQMKRPSRIWIISYYCVRKTFGDFDMWFWPTR